MKTVSFVSLLILLVACQDSTSPSEACRGQMADVRRTWGTPFNTVTSGDDAIRTEVWEYHDGENIRRFRFRWGTLTEGCTVQSEVVAP
jgi:hypothetical protein